MEASMTQLLKMAFEAASKLPAHEQDELAKALLQDLEAEARWASALDASADVLAGMADEAIAEHRAGRTLELDPDRL
jgi:hypothetical protein